MQLVIICVAIDVVKIFLLHLYASLELRNSDGVKDTNVQIFDSKDR